MYTYKQVRPSAALASLHSAPRPQCAMLENSLTNTPLVTACHWLFTYHCQSLLERARVIFAENSKIAEVVVHGGGSRGGPVASFTRTTSRHSLLQRQAPCVYPQSHAVGTDRCAIFRIVATVIDYFSLLVTACHRVVTYHCLVPVLAGKNEHRLVLFTGKSEHHLDPVNTCFTPTDFYVHGSQVKVHRECAHATSVSVTNVRMYAHTHTDKTNWDMKPAYCSSA